MFKALQLLHNSR